MSEPTPEDVIAMARREMTERALAARPPMTEASIERPWLWLFAGVFGMLLLAMVFWPGFPLQWKMYAVVHGVCAQQHNITLGGVAFPICARNSGIYISFLLTMGFIYAIGRGRAGGLPPLTITITLVAFVVIMGVDGFNSFFVDIGQPYLYIPNNLLRTVTGMGMGVSIAVMLHLVMVKTLRKDVDEATPIIRGWRELLGILLIDLLVLLAIYGNLSLLYWPLAFSAFFGIIGVLYLVSLLLISLFMGFEGRVTNLRQLARPATIAIIPTLIILGSMAWLRFWLESLGLMI